ncbi:MAG: hypothetical protein HC896_08325 [Bacteroidales bacterium]|nr:hypothetical protein [Bacteroidales bacterium]
MAKTSTLQFVIDDFNHRESPFLTDTKIYDKEFLEKSNQEVFNYLESLVCSPSDACINRVLDSIKHL